jgi:hypothetical protein
MIHYHEQRVPHIWPGFGKIWGFTGAGARVPVVPMNSSSRAFNTHISPKQGEIWGTPMVVMNHHFDATAAA